MNIFGDNLFPLDSIHFRTYAIKQRYVYESGCVCVCWWHNAYTIKIDAVKTYFTVLMVYLAEKTQLSKNIKHSTIPLPMNIRKIGRNERIYCTVLSEMKFPPRK